MMDRLIKVIARADETLHREEEKRIALESLPPECREATRVLELRQAFIREVREDNRPMCDVRIRETREKEKRTAYSMTAKFRPKRQEATTEISRDMFCALWPKTFSKQEKRRYLLETGWVVDEFKNGRIVAEFEYGKGKTAAHQPTGFKAEKVLDKKG